VGTSVAPATATNVDTSGVPEIVTNETVHDNVTGGKEVSDPEVVIMGNSAAIVSDTGIAKRTRSRA
ncbi:hypothetical protein A2U01_0105816, partial [Trifolium medium]|nr:hypothetical protein [Trifolium medium]